MTYRRDPDTWAGRITAAMGVLGSDGAARVAGVSASRLRQLANPMRADCAVLDVAVALDVACARAGAGTPILDLFQSRLAVRGIASRLGVSAGRAGLAATVQTVVASLRTIGVSLRGVADSLEAAMRAPWESAPARIRAA